MSVGVLLITDGGIGQALMNSTRQTFGRLPLATRLVAVSPERSLEELALAAKQMISELNTGDGVLALTDLYGSTPSNLCAALADGKRVVAVAGLNLPMLIRIYNYPRASLPELSHIAVAGGRDGVMLIEQR